MGPDGKPVAVSSGPAQPTSAPEAGSGSVNSLAALAAALGNTSATPVGLGDVTSLYGQVVARTANLPKESKRFTRLKQLSFDRRPSVVLKEWAPKSENKSETPSTAANLKDQVLEDEVLAFQKMVVLGDWAKVKAYLASLPTGEGAAVYDHLLQTFQQPAQPQMMMPPGMPQPPNMMQFMERPSFSVEDVVRLAAAAPPRFALSFYPDDEKKGLTKKQLAGLGGILSLALGQTMLPEVAAARFKHEVAQPQPAFIRREAARILIAAGQAAFIGDFLPSPEKAQTDQDLEALNLLAQHYLALHGRDKQAGHLERAWTVTQATLAFTEGSKEQQEEALRRAVEIAPRIKETLGQAWLDASFSKHPERGMQILATTGSFASQGLVTRPMQLPERLGELKLVKVAVEALLKAAPERAKEWKPTLTLLAAAWLKEAEHTKQYDYTTGMGASMRRDFYGNFYFVNYDDPAMQQQMMMARQGGLPQAIVTADVLQARPNDAWLAHIDPDLRPRLSYVLAQLYLKAGEEQKAFPYIETLAAGQPEQAKELAKEFLRVWTKNHNPNQQNQFRNPYIYFYGFEVRADSIPLTRSKQERNLADLAMWVDRLRKIKLGELDEDLLSRAFTACHSSAEVYKIEAIEKVFGPLGKLKPRTLSSLAQTMRGNLAGLWRNQKEQEKTKTNRKQKDIEIEVLRGYEVARNVIDDGLKKFPDHWALLLAQAALVHDEINYRAELAKTADFSKQRAAAMASFNKAAQAYAKVVATLPEDEQTTQVFDQWFYASLGAVDLGVITEDKQPDWKQPPLIKQALAALPGELAQQHLDKFANALFTRMSSAKPQIKFTYLKGGFMIVDPDHKLVVEARKVYDYYKDLVKEIRLEVKIDGSDDVGHGEPFGVFVNLRHTRDIERESGGFGKYLQNQNSMYFSYNYGRPNTDYRDRFEAAVREAYKEHFDVLSVTFQKPEVNSRADQEYGWRYTPYAYLLVKARGPQVDKLPAVRLDMDFLDTSGYVVLPVESAAVPVNCRAALGKSRPVQKITLVQTLDERQADKGKLIVEIRASGLGLVGKLDQLVDLNPGDFDIVKTEDQGVAVSKFDTEGKEGNFIVSERIWQITLNARSGLTELPRTFRFGTAKTAVHETVFQRFQDADVITAAAEVTLEKEYGKKSQSGVWIAATAGAAGFLLVIACWIALLRRKQSGEEGTGLPDRLTPFTVHALLQETRRSTPPGSAEEAQLVAAQAAIERYYFAGQNGEAPPDLANLARLTLRR
jgi:hypothetical protein